MITWNTKWRFSRGNIFVTARRAIFGVRHGFLAIGTSTRNMNQSAMNNIKDWLRAILKDGRGDTGRGKGEGRR